METNRGCELPCWWGIEPGVTSEKELIDFHIENGYSLSPYQDYRRETIYYLTNIYLLEFSQINSADIPIKDGLVESITMRASNSQNFDYFKSFLSSFSPEEIVNKYKEPSRVWIEVTKRIQFIEETKVIPYSIWLFYDDLGILLVYHGHTDNSPTLTICPTFEGYGNLDGFFDLHLQHAERESPIERVSANYRLGGGIIRKPLNNVTDLDLQDFHRLFSQENSGSYCFVSTRDAWIN